MEGTPATPAGAAPLLPPQAPPTDALYTAAAHQRNRSADEVTASDTAHSTSTAPLMGRTTSSQDDAVAGKTKAPVAAQQQNGVHAHNKESVVDILHGLTTSVGINAELQCTLCHEVLCKPVTSPCGHSFCRVCLVEYLLSKELAETQCPICRGLVLHSSVGGDDAAPAFSINVTLWNLIQVLVPASREQNASDEDADYALKYDQFNAKWRIATLQQSGPRRNGRRHRLDSDDAIDSSDDEMDAEHHDGSDSEHDLDDGNVGRRARYPELRQENSVDGHLEVFRNVVLDRDDVNEDGYEGMRVSLAVMEFPSLFQPFNEHQECSVVVLKCEEDEDMDGGIPFFTSDDGDDDEFIISDYFNEIRLRVTDDTGNVVMERTRGATQGIATFPNLRLDVPSGMYDFQFKDDLYGIRLTIRTEVRDLRDEDDNPDLDGGRAMDLILDQAGERSRSRGRPRNGLNEDEDDEEGSESGSNDSFIVDDDEELEHDAEGAAQFSGDEGSEGEWMSQEEEDEEESMERRERALRERIRRHHAGRAVQSPPNDEQGDAGDSDAEADEIDGGSGQVEEPDSDEADHLASVSSGRSAKRNRIVDDDSGSDGDDSTGDDHRESGPSYLVASPDSTSIHQTGRKRPRAIMESEDDETKEGEEHRDSISSAGHDDIEEARNTEPMRGFSSNKRLRQIASRMFHDHDEDEEGQWNDGNEIEHDDDVEDYSE